ncbi:MAG: hypothetical protein PX483_11830 [Nostocales cyanobacterium LE14-WE4]|jgi:predicted DNA-binding protein YlxM (UPF0122 family)|nr:hypothetical protein [Anabaena sp. 49633_E8]MCE2699726.1 hypothetical protein [Anabaena sp. 49633_E8]MDJ0501527.1 hypothetical protein [Nostocales cyanobacterium LE14-WE4]OBQ14682.1 MAG: hypothetical protein AN482_01025 [Anabaena sp. LE011-02]
MLQNTYQLPLTFDQILTLVKQLSNSEKLLLSKELEKETLNNELTELLEIFQTDELSLEEITEEVEIVRSQIYNRKDQISTCVL